MGGGGGKGGGGTTTAQYPPEMRALYNATLPMVYAATGNSLSGKPLYYTPDAPQLPKAPYTELMRPAPSSWYLNDLKGGYDVPSYDIADTTNLSPTKDWWSNISSGVKQGIMQPIEEGADTLSERLNKYGQLGSSRGGVSGTASEGLSNYYAKAMPQAELAGWQMMQPGALAAFQAQNQANRDVWGGQLGSNIAGFGVQSQGALGDWQNENQNRLLTVQNIMNSQNMDYTNRVNQLNQQWAYQNQAYAAPWSVAPTMSQTVAGIPSIGNYEPSTGSKVMSGISNAGMFGLGLGSLMTGNPMGLFK